MDLLRLKKYSYLPDMVIEGWSSLIWTERAFECGEFELKTSMVEKTRMALPELALVAIRESDAVMIVETHQIERDGRGQWNLTVKGRTIDSILEMRSTWQEQERHTMRKYYGGQALGFAITKGFIAPEITSDRLPNVVVTDDLDKTDESRYWLIQPGDIANDFRRWQAAVDMVCHIRRPPLKGSSLPRVLNFRPEYPQDPYYLVPSASDYNCIAFDIRKPSDRSFGNTKGNKPVVFNAKEGHFTNESYLRSIQDHASIAYVITNQGRYTEYAKGYSDSTGPYGRRAVTVAKTGVQLVNQTSSAMTDTHRPMALEALAQHKKVRLFDGEVIPNNPNNFNVDYFIGDIVTLYGDYGFNEDMRVVEYIRSEDSQGYRAYPTLGILT